MRKYILLVLIVPFFVACNQKKLDKLETRNDSLVQQSYAKDQAINDFLKAMNEIQYNLDSIKSKEMIITEATEGNVELRKNQKDQIIEDVHAIHALVEENKTKLDELRKQLGKSNYQVMELEKMLENMTKQLEQKDQEIAALTDMLRQMDIKVIALARDVQRLNKEGERKSQTIDDQSRKLEENSIALNTAFYVVGTKKDLKNDSIISNEGGFIGIGKEKKLADDFDLDNFTKIDIRETQEIIIPAKKIEIVTSHPSGSYTTEKREADVVLTINDPEEFWKNSKYLVIVI